MVRYCLVLVLAWSVAACSAGPANVESEPFASEYFTVSVIGEGEDVILVPGLASGPDVWTPITEDLKESYRLHLVHVSGFAGAPARGNAENDNILDDLSADLSAYANTLEHPAHLVGHSLGGLVAMKTALEPEANLKSLVVVDVLPFFSVLIDEGATAEKMMPAAAMMKATLIAQSDEVFAKRQAETISSLVKATEYHDMVLSWSLASEREVMGQAMSEVVVTDLRGEIANIDVPVTIIFARDEAIPNMASIEALYETLYAPLQSGTVIGIDEAFHFIMLDQPALFSDALTKSFP